MPPPRKRKVARKPSKGQVILIGQYRARVKCHKCGNASRVFLSI